MAKAENVFQLDLGVKVRDKITDFEGVITGRAEYITGCRQYCVSPKAKDNEFTGAQWLDEDRLLNVTPLQANAGGPQSSPAPTK